MELSESMKKVERDGKVAVLYSPGFGAGWASWNAEYAEVLCMDAEIVQAVIDKDIPKAVQIAMEKCPGIYPGGAEKLKVVWLDKGETFEIHEYDGSESVRSVASIDFMRA